MKFRIYSEICLLVLMASCSQQTTETTSKLEVYADSLYQASLDSTKIAGGAILVAKGDSVLLDKTYGYASLELQTPMPEEPVFEIGSVTKQFTAVAILKLVQQGKLKLYDDFTKYVEFDTGGRTVTIHQLLNHTSGIESYTDMPEFWPLSTESHPRDSLLRVVENKGFIFEPGEALIYNNTGYFLLGLIIEKVAEMPYEEFLQKEIFDPLEMHNTSYCSTKKVTSNKVYGYNLGEDGLEQKPYLDHTWPYAAGSLCSSTRDLYMWMYSLHNGRVLPDNLYEELISPKALKDGTPVRYAMGLTNFKDHNHPMISHGGGIHGFLSDTRYLPEEDLYIISLVNTAGPHGGNFFAEHIQWQLLDKETEMTSQDQDMDLAELEGTYAGQVRGQQVNLNITQEEDKLLFSPEDSEETDTLEIYAGKGRWLKENQIFHFRGDTLHVDQVSGHYVLIKG
ncbi:serine hydrolase domain-containing protein [Robertkochia aurantiaca]|uniref:serine hydrolase domain-containing protein n=1 Tax=Robertkochia aurantiaca TaxID=2873700 RepID=UPI001CCFF10A|nr:serine hydrolase domain-containing protein [Robertkochia sp. 3YJGBD-33]